MFGQAPLTGFVTASAPPLLDAESKQNALQRTEETLKGLLQICKGLGLSPTALPQILPQLLEVYAAAERSVFAENQLREMTALQTTRVPMEMRSLGTDRRPVRVRPGEIYDVLVRPQWAAYRVEEIVIEGDPSQWRVHDIIVGGRSQLPNEGAISGVQFKKGGVMSDLRLAACQTAMDFVLRVEYVGLLPEGEMFEACLLGTAAM